MSQDKKCPECGFMMKRGVLSAYGGSLRLLKSGDFLGDNVIPFYCENCGYIEFYNEKNIEKGANQ